MTTTASRFIIAFLSLFISTAFIGVAQTAQEIEYYLKLNDKETRHSEFKDSKKAIMLKLKQVEYINKSRAAYNVQPVKLDILASRVANQICVEGAKNGFMGHFGLDGSTPFTRYAAAGGTDHVSENASSISSSEPLDTDDESISAQMMEMHDSFMAEKAPYDGHKKTCIDKDHNYVGIGYATHGGEFRYYEEFLDRYLDFKPFTRNTKLNKGVSLSFKTLDDKKEPYCVMAQYFSMPQSMTKAQINKIRSYKDFSENEEVSIWKNEMPQPGADGYTTIDFKFKKKGLYYIKIYIDDKTTKKKSSMSTRGKTEASGVVIVVE